MEATGAGEASTQITLLSRVNQLTGTPSVAEFNTTNINPVMCMGNATVGPNTCTSDVYSAGVTGSTSVSNIVLSSLSITPDLFLPHASGVTFKDVWVEGYYGVVVFDANAVTIDKETVDIGVVYGAVIIGDGSNGSSSTSSWFDVKVTNSLLFEPYYGIFVDGMPSVLLTDNSCHWARTTCLQVKSPESYTTYNLKWLNNIEDGNPRQAGFIPIDYESPCYNCEVGGSSFNGNPIYDAYINTALTNWTFHDNILMNGQTLVNVPSIYTNGLVGGNHIIHNNTWKNPGTYAVFTDSPTVLTDNVCANPFTAYPPVGGGSNIFQNGCFYFTDGSTGTIARNNNVTADGTTKCGVSCVAINAFTDVATDTSDNRSPYNGCALCVNNNSTGISHTWNERSQNCGSSGDALFVTKFDQVAGIIILPAGMVPVASSTQTAGQLACIKSSGPPPVYGTCTAVSGAACTSCN